MVVVDVETDESVEVELFTRVLVEEVVVEMEEVVLVTNVLLMLLGIDVRVVDVVELPILAVSVEVVVAEAAQDGEQVGLAEAVEVLLTVTLLDCELPGRLVVVVLEVVVVALVPGDEGSVVIADVEDRRVVVVRVVIVEIIVPAVVVVDVVEFAARMFVDVDEDRLDVLVPV